MRSQRGRQNLASGIGHGERGLQGIIVQREGNLEPERKRIDRARPGILVQHETAGGGTAVQPGKAPVARETVLRQVIRLPLMPQTIVLQAPDDREQHRSVARPGRPCLPQHFLARGVAQ